MSGKKPVRTRQLPDFRELNRMFMYDAATGILRWRDAQPDKRSKVAGKIAGWPVKWGYRMVEIDGKRRQAHRIIWKMEEGYDPVEIDHINGDPSDNRWDNLRHATRNENGANQKRHRDNTSGVKGVCWRANRGEWVVLIRKDDKSHYLGQVATPEEGREVYLAGARRLFGEFASDGERNSMLDESTERPS